MEKQKMEFLINERPLNSLYCLIFTKLISAPYFLKFTLVIYLKIFSEMFAKQYLR